MPVEITVGPPVLTINQGSAFMVTDQRGESDSESEQGVFSGDTRFVSYYALYINGSPWQLLTSAAVHYYASRIELANPTVVTEDGVIKAQDVGLTLRRRV